MVNDCLNYVFNLFNGSVFYLVLALGGLSITFIFLFILLMQCYGYIPNIKKSIKRTNSFLNKHLLIQDCNVESFYNKCMAIMPANIRNAWKNFYENQDKKAGDCLAVELFKRKQIDYKNNFIAIFFKLACTLIITACAVVLRVYSYELELILLAIIAYLVFAGIAFNFYLLCKYFIELTYDSIIDDYINQMNRFVRIKAPIQKLNQFNSDKLKNLVTGSTKEGNFFAQKTTSHMDEPAIIAIQKEN